MAGYVSNSPRCHLAPARRGAASTARPPPSIHRRAELRNCPFVAIEGVLRMEWPACTRGSAPGAEQRRQAGPGSGPVLASTTKADPLPLLSIAAHAVVQRGIDDSTTHHPEHARLSDTGGGDGSCPCRWLPGEPRVLIRADGPFRIRIPTIAESPRVTQRAGSIRLCPLSVAAPTVLGPSRDCAVPTRDLRGSVSRGTVVVLIPKAACRLLSPRSCTSTRGSRVQGALERSR